MTYPIFSPRGESGWHTAIPHVQERDTAHRNKSTLISIGLRFVITLAPFIIGKSFFNNMLLMLIVRLKVNNWYSLKEIKGLFVLRDTSLMDHLTSRADARGL